MISVFASAPPSHRLLAVFLGAGFLTWVFSFLAGRLAARIGWIDRPGGLKTHAKPTPYGGGVAILVGLLLALVPVGALEDAEIRVILTAGLLILLGGVWDDWRPMNALKKFSIQAIAGGILVFYDVQLKIELLPTWLNESLTVFWVIALTNAVNLTDIMDGLCATICGIAAFTFALILALTGDFTPAILGFALAGALTGYLPHNFHPARLFMGDTGAQFTGFLLAALAVRGSYTAFNNIALIAPLLILGIPLYDTALVSILRLRKGISPFHGSPDHVAIRLRRVGFSIQATVRILAAIGGALAIAATAAIFVRLEFALVIHSITLATAAAFGVWIAGVNVEKVPPSITRIGVTGALGAGKSLFTRLLAEELATATGRTVEVIEADRIARELIEARSAGGAPGPILAAILTEFGRDLLLPDGTLDRPLLARRAFASEEKAQRLNALVHPAVRAQTLALAANPMIIYLLDVPLLFESGADRECGITIAVTAPREIRRERARRFLDFDAREARQWPEERKTAAATMVVDNSGSVEELRRKTAELAEKLVLNPKAIYDSP
jgi:UDP-GlcNAc:undecaprenyl-phosphate GlcNAc-1-phosphate transferase